MKTQKIMAKGWAKVIICGDFWKSKIRLGKPPKSVASILQMIAHWGTAKRTTFLSASGRQNPRFGHCFVSGARRRPHKLCLVGPRGRP